MGKPRARLGKNCWIFEAGMLNVSCPMCYLLSPPFCSSDFCSNQLGTDAARAPRPVALRVRVMFSAQLLCHCLGGSF